MRESGRKSCRYWLGAQRLEFRHCVALGKMCCKGVDEARLLAFEELCGLGVWCEKGVELGHGEMESMGVSGAL